MASFSPSVVEAQSLPFPGKHTLARPRRLALVWGGGRGDCPWEYLEKSARMTNVPDHPDKK